MASTLEVGDQGGQMWSDKAGADHWFVDEGVVRLLTARAVASHATVLANLDRTRHDVHLLHGPRWLVARLNVSPAIRAPLPAILPRRVDLLGREQRSLMATMSGLCPLLTLALSTKSGLRRLDDIARGRFG